MATRPRFGGLRRWRRCQYGRRVTKLYLARRTDRFACRTCHDLTYRSAQEHDKRVDFFRRNPDIALSVLDSHLSSTTILKALQASMKTIKDAERMARGL